MKHEFRLSICMMVKNEEKNLRRCLEALKPLTGRADVELIIIDTGSTDNTANIASEFTEKVYFHPWGNNFSEMRNISLSYAKGDYILVMDADEVLLDAIQLNDLITDKRLESFNTYIFKVKNYSSMGTYTILPQERVFKNDGEFRFEGSVHNQPQCKPPYLATEIYIDHYGYLFDDDRELRERKFLRTGGILKEELKKDPDNIYYRFQLARSYNAHNDKNEALVEIRKAYRLITGRSDLMKQYAYLYSIYAIICCENCEFEEAIHICAEGIAVRSENIDLYFIKAAALIRLNRRSEALEAYKKYIDLVGKYEELAISSDRAMEMHYMSGVFQDEAAAFIAKELFSQGKFDEAYKYARLINDNNSRNKLLSAILIKQQKFAEIKSLYDKNLQDKKLREAIIGSIEGERQNYSLQQRKDIEQLFSTGEDIYSLLNRIRSSEGEERKRLVAEALKYDGFDELPYYYAEIFSDFQVNTRQAVSVLKRLRKSKIVEYFKWLLDNNGDLKEFIENYLLEENIRDDDFQGLKFYIGIADVLLLCEAMKLRKSKNELPEQYYSIFKRYTAKGMNYINLLYNTERLRLMYNYFEDREDCFFTALNFSVSATANGDYKAGIKYFREAAKANPYLTCYMNKYKDELFPESNESVGEDEDNG